MAPCDNAASPQRGGTFTTTGLDVVNVKLDGLRWIDNVAVSGKVKWDRASGAVTANITCTGTADCNLKITWNYNAAYAVATVTGKIEGASVSLTLPAP